MNSFSVIHMDQSHDDKVIFRIIGVTKCFKLSRPNFPVVCRACAEDELLFPVKCIYAYLAKKSENEFVITFGKPHYPTSKDLLARWVKEVMGNSGIDTGIFKPLSTMVASKITAYKSSMVLQEVLKIRQ